jgi:ATP-dependent Clp protease protease subunit
MHSPVKTALLGLALATVAYADTSATAAKSAPAATKPVEAPTPATTTPPTTPSAEKAKDDSAAEKKESPDVQSEISKLKAERELIAERNALEDLKRAQADREADVKFAEEKARLNREGELSRIQAERLANELKAIQSQAALDLAKLQNEVARMEAEEKRSKYADSKPEYLANPLRDDGVLVISDRRIALNGPIGSNTADYITERIHYWNNKDRKLPIFIVIDDCPGGSVMSGYRILKSMEASEAPIHVVVKSFAASMAACITTLANESYAYPNAIILHHQLSSTRSGRLNLTQQREYFEDSNRWWERLAGPVAKKMGVSTDEFIKQMYAKATSGDWSEFGDQAKELKWVNHIINGVEETSLVKNPDSPNATPAKAAQAEHVELDKDGNPVVYLPRLNPKDCYFLYNPDGYYQVR